LARGAPGFIKWWLKEFDNSNEVLSPQYGIHVDRIESVQKNIVLVSREVVGVRPMILSMSVRLQTCPCVSFIALANERAPSDLCMCPFYCGQVMDRCACSGSSCLNPFYDMFMTHLWKGDILHLRIINL